MHANLVSAAGLQLDPHERAVRRDSERTDSGDRALAVLAHTEGDGADARDGRVDRLRLAKRALAKREVALSNLLDLKVTGESRVDVCALGEKDDATSSAVEPLEEKKMSRVLNRQLEKYWLVWVVTSLDDDVSWFVNEEQRFVLVKDFEPQVAWLLGCLVTRHGSYSATEQPSN